MADPSGATGLAVTVNDNGASAILTSFGGENVDDQDVLVMYTYQGDANLDGRINADDYFQIDQGYRLQSDPAYRNYHGGDFDLSGAITADNFYLIDRSFLHQGASLGLAAMAALAAARRRLPWPPAVSWHPDRPRSRNRRRPRRPRPPPRPIR